MQLQFMALYYKAHCGMVMILRTLFCARIPIKYCPKLSLSSPFMRCIVPSTMAKLPRLPVSDLRKLLDRYLQSIQPFLREDEAYGHTLFEVSYPKCVQWVDDFEKGIGRLYQRKLYGMSFLVCPFTDPAQLRCLAPQEYRNDVQY